MTTLQCWFLALAMVFPSLLTAGQSSPEGLQDKGIARLDQIRDQIRRDGIQQSLLSEFDAAASELALSYRCGPQKLNYGLPGARKYSWWQPAKYRIGIDTIRFPATMA